MVEWQKKLEGFFQQSEKSKQDKLTSELARFIEDVVMPAFDAVKQEMEKHGRDVTIRNASTSASLSVHHGGEEELTYRVQGRIFPSRVLPYVELRFRERKGLRLLRTEVMFRDGAVEYGLTDITREEIIQHFVDNYVRRVKVE